MAEQHLRQRYGYAAIASRVRRPPDGTQEIEYLCEIDLAEEPMSGRLRGGRSLFDDVFDRSPAGGGGTGRAQAPARRTESVDLTQFFHRRDEAAASARRSDPLESGSLDVASDHLLFAALQDDVVRHVLEHVRADPGAVAAQVEEEAEKGERTSVAPSPTPDAKGASPPTRSRASSAPPTSGPSTCCSHSRATRSRRRDTWVAVEVAGDRLRFEVDQDAARELLRERKEEGTPGVTGSPA